jgi:hypothetical protein
MSRVIATDAINAMYGEALAAPDDGDRGLRRLLKRKCHEESPGETGA